MDSSQTPMAAQCARPNFDGYLPLHGYTISLITPALLIKDPGQAMKSDEKTTDRRRFFIINLGRCGSSLLSAVLADSGANFGLPVPQDWDPSAGQMESKAIKLAAHHYRRAYDISEGRKYIISPAIETKYRLSRGRANLGLALHQSVYVKISDLDLVVQASFKLGYEPKIIVNFRQLEPMLPSLLVGRKHIGPDQLARDYVRIYRQGLIQLQVFGGCVVSYNDLQNPKAHDWASALAAVSGLDGGNILAARDTRLKRNEDGESIEPVYAEAFEVFEKLSALQGQVLSASRQVERAIEQRNA